MAPHQQDIATRCTGARRPHWPWATHRFKPFMYRKHIDSIWPHIATVEAYSRCIPPPRRRNDRNNELVRKHLRVDPSSALGYHLTWWSETRNLATTAKEDGHERR